MQNTLYIPIEVTNNNPFECEKLVKRGDTVVLNIKVFSNGALTNLTGQSIDLILKKSDGTLIQKEIDTTNISNGTVTAKLDIQATVMAGLVSGELQLSDSNGQNSTNTFTFNVSTSIADNVIEISRNDINILNELRQLIANGEAVIAQYEEHILAIANSIEAIEALQNIKNYIDTNLAALESNNAQAVVNINNLKAENDKAPTLATNLKAQNDTATSNISTLTTKNQEAVTNKNNIDSSISTANASKIALDTSKTNADNTKSALDTLNTTANNTKDNLNVVNQTGQTLLDSLDNFEDQHADVTGISNQLANVNAQLSDIAKDVCAKGAAPVLSDNTSIIQAELNKKGHVVISKPGTYLVSGLVIYDNTFFELYPGVELKLKDNSSNYLLRNELGLTSDKTNRNINIRIKGGIWTGNSSNNPKTGTWQNGGFPGWGVLLNHVEYIKLEDMFLQDYLKYCFHIIDCTNLYTTNIGFNNISDGMHFQPPLKNAFINNTYGTTGDDMIAFTLGDFPNYVVSQEGNFEDIIIDGVNADSCVSFVKITGAGLNGAYAFRNISINNLNGVVTRYIASIIEDRTYDTGGLMYTMCENVSFNHIKASGSCFVIDTYKANLYFNDISIDNPVWFQVSYGGTTPQDVNLMIDGAYSPYGKNIGTAFILLQNNAKIGNLILNNCALDLNAVPLIKVLTSSTFKLIEINNVICKNVGTGGMYIYEDSGNTSEATILINNSVFDGFEKGEMYHTKVKVRHTNSELLNTTDRMYLYSTAQVNVRDINCGIQGVIYGESGSSYTLHDPWTPATLINNWSVYGQNTPSYFKDALGIVHIRGEVTGGAVNTVIFTLPTGYRPNVRMWFPINSNDGNNNIYGMVQIAGDGTVKLVTGGTSYLGLVNISFVAEL